MRQLIVQILNFQAAFTNEMKIREFCDDDF